MRLSPWVSYIGSSDLYIHRGTKHHGDAMFPNVNLVHSDFRINLFPLVLLHCFIVFTHLTDGRHDRSLGYPNLIWFNQAVSSSFTHCFIVLPKSYLELFELVKKTMGSNSLMFSIHLNTIAKRSLIYKQIEFNKVF